MPPERFKTLEDLTVDEHLRYRHTGRLPETEEYRQARRDTLAAAGFVESDAEPELEDMTVDDHVRRQGRAA